MNRQKHLKGQRLDIKSRLEARLQKRKDLGSYRLLPRMANGIDFFSNDYLGLAKNKDVYERVGDSSPLAALSGGKLNGSSGSRLLSGNNPWFEGLERELSEFFNSESALIFNSGFNLNMGLLQTICEEEDVILLDQNIHASLKIGAKLSKATSFYFKHNDLDHLEKKLNTIRKTRDGNIFVVTEGLFSMDGDIPDFLKMIEISTKYGANLIVDEAHSIGIYGEQGRGLISQLDLEDKIFCRIITFGKVYGCFGSALLGPEVLKRSMVNFCPSFIYTTSLPLNNLLTIRESLRYRKESNEETEKLWQNINLFSKEMDKKILGPIYAHHFSDLPQLKLCAEKLKENGFKVLPIMSPTVQRGTERIRICIHSYNTQREIYELTKILKEFT